MIGTSEDPWEESHTSTRLNSSASPRPDHHFPLLPSLLFQLTITHKAHRPHSQRRQKKSPQILRTNLAITHPTTQADSTTQRGKKKWKKMEKPATE